MKCLRMRLKQSGALALSIGLVTVPASAAITVDKAVIDQGSLQVEGTSTRGSVIKLDNTYSASIVQGKLVFQKMICRRVQRIWRIDVRIFGPLRLFDCATAAAPH